MTKTTMVTLDLETTIRSPIGTSKASAFWPDNYIVYEGRKLKDGDEVLVSRNVGTAPRRHLFYNRPVASKTHIVVGQNIKFDIHHLRKLEGSTIEIALDDPKTIFWDTQIAEYILTGQDRTFADLDSMAVKYGGTVKDDRIKELWESGVDTPDISYDMMTEYLEGDVKNTELVAKAQMWEADRRGILPILTSQMDAMLAVEEMEYNGMAVDLKLLADKEVELSKERDDMVDYLVTELQARGMVEGIPYDTVAEALSSNQFLSAVIFGGDYTFKWRESNGVYKSGVKKGEPRYRWEKKTACFLPMVLPHPEWETKKDGVFSVADHVLDEVKHKCWMAGGVRKIRHLDKEINTYYKGLPKLIYPDGLIHHELHQCSTKTGRLSSSKPNGQNLPSSEESDVKKAFVSRWGNAGSIIEADYKQLEVIALAHLSKDHRLLKDLKEGRDIHAETGKRVYGPSMTKDERRVVKTINFGLIYGGGAKTLSKQSGEAVSLVKKLIEAFYTRYPRVKEWQKEVYDTVQKNALWEGDRSKNGMPVRVSQWKSETGRVYTFREKEVVSWTGKLETMFKPSETNNYPVQGLATGDIVPTMLGILRRVLKNNPRLKDQCLMVNQVHDSAILDCHNSVLEEACDVIKETLEDAPRVMYDKYGVDLGDLPLKVEVSYGPNWKEQHEL